MTPDDAGRVPPLTVPTHNLTRYLRVRLEVAAGVMRWEVPRTLFGIAPVGTLEIAVPVEDVASLDVGRTVRPFDLLAGLACIVAPIGFGWWWALAPLIILGLWIILVSLGPRLEAKTRAGATHRADVCFGHQFDAELYMTAVTDLAAGR